jgi:hypothetical protein
MKKILERNQWSPDFTGKIRFYQTIFPDDKQKHFALIGPDNIVVDVYVLNPESCFDQDNLHSENVGIEFCNKMWGTPEGHFWKQTFKNDEARGYYGFSGSTWNSEKQIFIIPQPVAGVILAEDGVWETPTPKPLGSFHWDPNIQDWAAIENYNVVVDPDGISHIYDDDGNLIEI